MSSLEHVRCNLCGADKSLTLFEPTGAVPGSARRVFSAAGGVMGTQRVVRCRECGLAYVDPRFRAREVLSAYATSTDEGYVSQQIEREKTFERSLRLVERFAPRRGKLLDVGCAAGFFLNVARRAGWKTKGVEPSRYLSRIARTRFRQDVATGTVESVRLRAGEFDVVTMWDVLEHAADPSGTVRRAARALKRGGLLVVNFPDFGSLPARLFGRRWWFVLSVHLYYFDRRSLRALLEKNGFRVVAMRRHWQSLTLGYLAGIVRIYSPAISSLLSGVFRLLHLSSVPFKYYAGQANAIAVRERR